MKLLLTLILTIATASATLVKTDFLNPNDGLIVKDTTTGFEWLTPLYTSGHVYNDPFVQSIISNYGFRYATAPEVVSMVNTNFGNPTTVFPGDLAGYNSASQFFNLFGIALTVSNACGGQGCNITQGLTSTPGNPGGHLAFGLWQFGPTGFFIVNNSWPDNNPNSQVGSFLIRPTGESVPEPSSIALIGMGLILVASHRKLRSPRKQRIDN